MGSTCRTFEELAQYLDGELSTEDTLDVSEHLPACSACRDLLNEASRLSRLLVRVPESAIPVNFEERFRRQLELRISEDANALRRSGFRPRRLAAGLASAAALVFALLFVRSVLEGPLVPSPDGGGAGGSRGDATTGGRGSATDAVHSDLPTPRARAREALDLALRSTELVSSDDELLSRWTRANIEIRRLGFRGEDLLAAAATDADPSIALSAIRVAGLLRRPENRAWLAGIVSRYQLEAPRRRAALVAIAGIPGRASIDVIADVGGRHAPWEERMEALSLTATVAAGPAIVALAKGRGPRPLASVIPYLERVPGPESTGMLLEVLAEAPADSNLLAALAAHLAGRSETAQQVRTVVRERFAKLRAPGDLRSRNPEGIEGLERLVSLVGRVGDSVDVPMLKALATELAATSRLQDAAFAALAGLGASRREGVVALAEFAPTVQEITEHPDEELRIDRLKPHFAALGDRGARLLVEEVGARNAVSRRRCILAAGLCGSSRIVPDLLRMLSRSDVRLEAIRSLGEICDAGALPHLIDLRHHQDPDVRREARRALDRLRAPEGGTPSARPARQSGV